MNDQCITEQIKKFLNSNENTTYQNPWETEKAVMRVVYSYQKIRDLK
jgi:hypothetical protein